MKIVSIQPAKKKKNQFFITLDNNEMLLVSPDIISQSNLYTGKTLTSGKINGLRTEAEMFVLKDYCFRILARKMYSQEEIRKKLRQKTKNENIISQVIADLTRLKLLDDEEFAELYVRSLKNKGKYSWREIRFRLYQKGIKLRDDNHEPEEIEDYEYQTAINIVNKRLGSRNDSPEAEMEKKKTFTYLYQKGFNTDLINRVMRDFD